MNEQTEFHLAGVSLPESTIETANRIMRLLPGATSASVVSEFLKSKGLHFSAPSWSEMISKRLTPALLARQITVQELSALLNAAEEYGKCHVFLFNAKKQDAESFVKRDRIEMPRIIGPRVI